MSLESLPNELLLLLSTHLPTPSLYALLHTNWHFSNLLSPLFRKRVLKALTTHLILNWTLQTQHASLAKLLLETAEDIVLTPRDNPDAPSSYIVIFRSPGNVDSELVDNFLGGIFNLQFGYASPEAVKWAEATGNRALQALNVERYFEDCSLDICGALMEAQYKNDLAATGMLLEKKDTGTNFNREPPVNKVMPAELEGQIRANPHFKDEHGSFGIHLAVSHGEIALVQHLLCLYEAEEDPKCRISLEIRDRWGRTALAIAVRKRNIVLARLLLAHGASARTCLGYYPFKSVLSIAAHEGDEEMVRLLIENGARVNSGGRGKSGATAIHYAAKGGSLCVVKELLKNGAGVWRDKYGRSPLDYAMKLVGAGKALKELIKSDWPDGWSLVEIEEGFQVE